MDIAQHADQILQAWKVEDDPSMQAALHSALGSCSGVRTASLLDQERRQLLQTVAEHLQSLGNKGSLPAFSKRSGAQTLLHHLRSDFTGTNLFGLQQQTLQ